MSIHTTKTQATVGLSAAAISGTGWVTTQSLINKFATLFAMYVIARQLAPEEFAIASLTWAIGKFIVVLPPLTMGDLMIRHQSEFKQIAFVGRRLVFRIGIVITILIIVLSPFIAQFYNKYPFAILVGLIAVVSLRPTGEAMAVIPLSRLRLDLQYRTIALIDGSVQFISTLATVVLAFMGAGAFSIVVPQIATIIVKTSCYCFAVKKLNYADSESVMEIGSTVSKKLFREFLTTGSAQYIHSMMDTLPIIVLGRFASETQTGFYGFAFQLAAQVNTIISFQLGLVLQPIFGRLKEDVARQTAAFLRAVRAISSIIVPFALIQAALAEPLFLLVFNPEWKPACEVFSILSIIEAIYFATAPTIALLKAQGRFRTYFMWQSAQLATSVFVYPLAATYSGAFGVAVAGAILWSISLPCAVWLGTRNIAGTWWQAIQVFIAPWTTALPIALLVYLLWRFLSPLGTPGMILSLGVVGPCCFAAALLATRISQPATFAEISPLIQKLISKSWKFFKNIIRQ